MVLELTCFNISSSLPTIPIINNVTNNLSHSYYNPNGKAISQLISSSLARSTFSIVDVRSFLKQITSDEIKSWDVSTIVKLKPITSTIIYTKHLLQQFKKLDQYSTQADSIVIKASYSVFVKGFDQILRETYFLDEIRQSISDSITHIKELDQLINQNTSLSSETYDAFAFIKNESNNMINSLKAPLQKLCDYADGNDKEIDDTIIKALNLVHQQMNKLIDTIRNDFLIEITPWENNMLMDKNLEDKIRSYIRLVGIILLVLTIVFGFIPITFFILIIIRHLCRHQQNDLSPKYRLVHATYFIFVLNLFLYLL
ncbi:unnamed protein product [Rotaria sordida]|uniref:Uncharacterized protein n=1 Tax=Rotaria sordida TaxID=392033 RepID=A0A815VKV4_9BILA|nr:unnamed protein product [Rotaria sordida]CAF1365940.1 unnamed protein product [Rotaria sordida]CAF1531744.1 unnamed protein product [Rotaria sordida]CAF1665847.1 unnamed protein product [Rotaria sordida]